MSKKLAALYGHKNFKPSQAPKPAEYTVLGINQPLIAPEIEAEDQPKTLPSAKSPKVSGQRQFRFSLLLNKLL